MNIPSVLITVLSFLTPGLAGLFSFWLASKKDGFDQNRSLDLVFIGAVSGLVLSLLTHFIMERAFSLKGLYLNPYSMLFGFFLTVYIVVRKWKWSPYRTLDNMATSLVVTLMFLLVLQNLKYGFRPVYLIGPVLLLVVSVLLRRLQESVVRSGFIFGMVTVIFCGTAMLVTSSMPDLLFLILLFTLSIAVLISRLTQIYGRPKVGNNSPGRS